MGNELTHYRSAMWREVARFIDRHEKEELLVYLASTGPLFHSQVALLPVAHGDPFLLREMLTELGAAGIVRRLVLREGPYYGLMPHQGLRDKVLGLRDYFAELPEDGRHHRAKP